MKQISDILNKVFCKGRKMDSMMEKLSELRGLVSKEEDFLKEGIGLVFRYTLEMQKDGNAVIIFLFY